jgi:CheY-like chemotaxis protein
MKVLVIDDEKATLTMFRLFLSAYGYDVEVAENGRTGLKILQTFQPPIVFTDLKMPEMDGFEVLRKIKKVAPNTEVIVVTGHGDMDLVVQALNLKATDFINKPVQRSALNSALKRAEARLNQPAGIERRMELIWHHAMAVIRSSGPLDGGSKAGLADVAAAACKSDPKAVVFEFDHYSTVDATGIAGLIQVLSDLNKKHLPAAITGLSENFKTIFEMVGVTRFAKLYDTLDDAIASMRYRLQDDRCSPAEGGRDATRRRSP